MVPMNSSSSSSIYEHKNDTPRISAYMSNETFILMHLEKIYIKLYSGVAWRVEAKSVLIYIYMYTCDF